MAQATQDLVIRMKTDSQNFNDGIEKAKGKVRDFKREGEGAGDGFKQGMATAKAAIGKIAIAVAAATAAIKTYKNFAEQTQTWGDELNSTIDACKTTFQNLEREILIGGNMAVGQIKKMYDEAYKLAQLKDQLGTLKISQQWNRGTYLTDYNEAMADYQEAKTKKDEEAMAKAAIDIQKALNGYTRESQALIQATKDETKQLLIANGINVKASENMYDVIEEVKQVQNGNLMGITQTLKELSKKTTTTYAGGTAGNYTVETGGLEWGKAKMRNMGYSEAQIAAAERQLRMSELNDEKYQELVSTLLEGKNVQNEIAGLRKRANRTLSATDEVSATTPTTIYTPKVELQTHGTQELIPELKPKEFEGEIKLSPYLDPNSPNAAMPLDEDWLNNAMAEYELKMLEFHDKWDDIITKTNAYGQALGNVASIFNNLASIATDDSPWKRFLTILGSVASGIMSLVQTYTSLVAVESVAQAIESGKGIPFPYNLIAIAAAGAAITGIIATIVATAKSTNFAQGGIVGGNDYHDGIHANLSTGEMVLNKNQQARLWAMIQSGGSGGRAENVVFKIAGEDLVGVIDNYNKNINY